MKKRETTKLKEKKGVIMGKDNYFKIDVELHLLESLEHYDYFPKIVHRKKLPYHLSGRALFGPEGSPGHSRPGDVLYGTSFWQTAGRQGVLTPEDLLALMDKYAIDMACLLPEVMANFTGYSTRWSSNGLVSEVCKKYPERFIFQPNVGPLLKRGLKEALWELEYLVKERNAKLVKFYPCEDTYINDPQIWPFYEKVNELDIPVCIHTGDSWVPNHLSKYSLPMLLEDVMVDFPEMKVICFHFGWPYFHDLNIVARSFPNVYVGTNLQQNWGVSRPRRFAELIGEAIEYVGIDRIVWGTDGVGPEAIFRNSVQGLADFQIPEDMQQGYGYQPLTEENKRKIFGLNLAKLLNIEPKRRVRG
ncbi:amidohydrolase family protein [Chloroflexota bacterium]